MYRNLLFSDEDLSTYFKRRKNSILKELEDYKLDYILNASETDLCNYLLEKYTLVAVKLLNDNIYVLDQKEIDIDVTKSRNWSGYPSRGPIYRKGLSITIALPFQGDSDLLKYKPCIFNFNPPAAEINGYEIHLIYQSVDHNPVELKKIYERDIREIYKWLGWIERDVNQFN